MPLLTLFSAPKPAINPHIATIQRNAVRSWQALGNEVEVVLLGNEQGTAELCSEFGIKNIKGVKTNSLGTPLISSLFDNARNINESPVLSYVNTDIILFKDYLESAKIAEKSTDTFLLVGQRWDMDIKRELDFSEGWQEKLRQDCPVSGKLHKPMGSDYFIFSRECFTEIPDFAVGRAGWDNWMIYESRRRRWKTIDGTHDIMIIHQNHDYAHLPDGQPHYRLPETSDNVQLAGGKRTIFTLADANLQLRSKKITPKPFSWSRFVREIEIIPLIKWHSIPVAELFHLILHPREFYARIRLWLGKLVKKGRE